MEPGEEALDTSENVPPCSGSDASQELCVSESLAGSYNEDDDSDNWYHLEPQSPHNPMSGLESPECLQLQDWECAGKQESLLEHDGKICLYASFDSITKPHKIHTLQLLMSSNSDPPEFEPHVGQSSWRHSRSFSSTSSSSLGCTDMTQAMTLCTEQPQGTRNRQDPKTGNRRVESSEEGGSSEAPPASVFFGISDECAEQAEKRNSGSDTDLCRPGRRRARHTRFSRNESQSERHVKETKSKCKQIAQLLTDAPNPQNKGALLFKKRRQRVKKYTLVSYGTGFHALDSEDQVDGKSDKVRAAGCDVAASRDSDLEEHCCLYYQQHHPKVNWGRFQEMEALPETKGKGVFMFAQRRKRMDALVSDHEELSKKLPVEAMTELQSQEVQNIYDAKGMYLHADETNYMDVNLKKHLEYHEDIQQMNNVSNMPKPLVPNRTARPFLGLQDDSNTAAVDYVQKRHEPRFKVPVPINTNPKVWSPTGDIIASRDERISVPAIKTGILLESKRKAANKHLSMSAQESDPHIQNKGERRSYIESEEDCFSLGAEACNFMQPRVMKLKNPPPVAPKPTINPACPPWMRSPSNEPYITPRSPISQPSPSPVAVHGQHYLQQQDRVQPQQMANCWASDQTQASLQTPANAWTLVSSSSKLHLQPTTNSLSQQQLRSPVSMQAHSPTYSPHLPSMNKSGSTPNSVVSCPPQAGKLYTTKALQTSSKDRVSDRDMNQSADGPALAGKGAALFAKRQSRMEKFVVDAETVQANKARSPSPSSSLPNSWRYSSNIRAPPPVAYNPLLAPFYPPSAAKQPPSTNPQTKLKTKEKPKSAPKQLNALEIMKHQPYQLDSSLFKYDATPEVKSPKTKPASVSKFEVTKSRNQRSASSQSSHNTSEIAVNKAGAPAKSSGWVSPKSPSAQITRSPELLSTDKHLDEKLTVTTAAQRISNKQAQSPRPASTTSKHSPFGDSIASAFSPASLIARGARQMAPRPKFSAKKPVVTGKQWKPVAMLHSAGFGRSRSLSLPQRLSSRTYPGLLSPGSTPGLQPYFLSTQKQTSFPEKVRKPPTPWEAASKTPLGSVDEAFTFQSFPSSVASAVKAAAHRKSLPEPPDEWKRRVSLDSAAVRRGHYLPAVPAFQALSMSRTFSCEKPAFDGPPFRPAHPLRPASRASTGNTAQGSSPTKYFHWCSAEQPR
ncbi:synaptopodin-2 [Xenentodon cancila]